MTVRELIAELETWPLESEVMICEYVPPPSCVDTFPIERVSGAAGATIDGRDSVVTIEYAEVY